MISCSHWGMFAVGYYIMEARGSIGYARYIHPGDSDYCPTASYDSKYLHG